jgi:hypothetical protein
MVLIDPKQTVANGRYRAVECARADGSPDLSNA